MKRKWWTITFYFNNVKDWIGKTPYHSTIYVNNLDDRVIDVESANKYAQLIKGKMDVYFIIQRGKIK